MTVTVKSDMMPAFHCHWMSRPVNVIKMKIIRVDNVNGVTLQRLPNVIAPNTNVKLFEKVNSF